MHLNNHPASALRALLFWPREPRQLAVARVSQARVQFEPEWIEHASLWLSGAGASLVLALSAPLYWPLQRADWSELVLRPALLVAGWQGE
ncbi:hypothetical protein [Parasedimentitalea huanghaiensis]|uniref:hypothetical protein n=1 Tax=Parasedimentitalea huanghaiensis TaxID=2682100 RepID=UPI001FD7D21E|nr:hypothetical protein [Zongyanglinia huanghaiensis]